VPDWRENWQFGKWALASSLSGCGMGYLLPWIIALAVDARATGRLAACMTVVNLVGMFITGVSNFLTPMAATAFARGGVAALNRVLLKIAFVYAATVGGFLVFVISTGDWLATFLYGSEFAGTQTVLALLAAQMLVNAAGITAGNGLWALDRARANFTADVCMAATTIACLAALVFPLGITGAALALIVGTIVGTAVRAWTYRLLARAARGAAQTEHHLPAAISASGDR
jgi:O-antigen/teichoic acid export membrane protein